MNVMKNWGCLNKIKLVGILLAGGLHFIFFLYSLSPLPVSYFIFRVYSPPKESFICSITSYLASYF